MQVEKKEGGHVGKKGCGGGRGGLTLFPKRAKERAGERKAKKSRRLKALDELC